MNSNSAVNFFHVVFLQQRGGWMYLYFQCVNFICFAFQKQGTDVGSRSTPIA